MQKQLLLFLSLCVLAGPAWAQANFRPGYVVTPTGDTLRGEVDMRGSMRNAQQARFRATPQAPVTEYQPNQLRAYGFVGDRVYETNTVMLPKPVRRAQLLGVTVEDTPQPVFLEVLARGAASLLFLRDVNNKDHFYLRMQTDGVVQELLATKTVQTVNKVDYEQQSDAYKRTLEAAMKSCLAVQPLLPRLQYRESALVQVVEKYNTCVGSVAVAPASGTAKSAVRVSLVAGAQKSQLNHYTGQRNSSGNTPTMRYINTLVPVVGLGVSLAPARLNKNISFRLNVLYAAQKADEEYDLKNSYGNIHEQVRLELSGLTVPLMVCYTFPKDVVRPFVQAGYSVTYFMNSQNEYRYRYTSGSFMGDYTEWKPIIEQQKTESGFTGGVGLTTARAAGRNLSLEVRYGRTNGFSEVGGEKKFNKLSLLLSYDLNK